MFDQPFESLCYNGADGITPPYTELSGDHQLAVVFRR
jgi:hypothetical protein